jgi:hypothetical protein
MAFGREILISRKHGDVVKLGAISK